MASSVLQQSKEKGRLGSYLYLLSETEDGTCLYFLDYGMEKSMSLRLLRICLYVGLLGIVLIFIPVFSCPDGPPSLCRPPLTSRSSLLPMLPMDLSSTVKNAALSFESLAFEYEKQFTMEIQDGLTMNGNEGNIRQLVTILLDNAFKYSGEHSTVSISLSSHGDKKILLVRNTGNGIPAEDQKHIFERFYRSEASRNRKYGGYGLGLAIASSIVTVHKGQLTVKSDEATYTAFTATFL